MDFFFLIANAMSSKKERERERKRQIDYNFVATNRRTFFFFFFYEQSKPSLYASDCYLYVYSRQRRLFIEIKRSKMAHSYETIFVEKKTYNEI